MDKAELVEKSAKEMCFSYRKSLVQEKICGHRVTFEMCEKYLYDIKNTMNSVMD